MIAHVFKLFTYFFIVSLLWVVVFLFNIEGEANDHFANYLFLHFQEVYVSYFMLDFSSEWVEVFRCFFRWFFFFFLFFNDFLLIFLFLFFLLFFSDLYFPLFKYLFFIFFLFYFFFFSSISYCPHLIQHKPQSSQLAKYSPLPFPPNSQIELWHQCYNHRFRNKIQKLIDILLFAQHCFKDMGLSLLLYFFVFSLRLSLIPDKVVHPLFSLGENAYFVRAKL